MTKAVAEREKNFAREVNFCESSSLSSLVTLSCCTVMVFLIVKLFIEYVDILFVRSHKIK